MPTNSQSFAKTDYQAVFDKAVKLLELRLHTKKELELKLFRYKYDKDVVNQVLARLEELKLLDDAKFAEIYLDNLIKYKTFGYYGIKAKLLARGITSGLAEKLLAENLDIDTETKIARKFLGKKSGEPTRLAASLQRKGFRNQVIGSCLDF